MKRGISRTRPRTSVLLFKATKKERNVLFGFLRTGFLRKGPVAPFTPPSNHRSRSPYRKIKPREKRRRFPDSFEFRSSIVARKSSKTFSISARNCSSAVFRFPKQKDPRYDRGGSREERNGAGDRTKTKFHARASLILPFFFLFLRSLSAKVNGACARCAEKVMDRALNVGSHGISDGGGGRGKGWRGIGPGANRLPPATTSPFSKQLGDSNAATTIMRVFDATSSLVRGRRNSPTLLTFEHDSADSPHLAVAVR